MATDFFERQDYARRQTVRLLVLFTLAVVTIVLAIYILVTAAMGSLEPGRPATHAGPALWDPLRFASVVLGVLLVICLASLYKISELSKGGESIALMLGGRAVNPQTRDLAERRLLNIVEEMALASGIPVPPVYVLDHESGINAFAAGHQPGDAVVAVSGGCLQYLTREELQGVMGHEFSHILNGDMRLNLRLIGILYGILVLAIIGYYVMRSTAFRSRGSKQGDGAAGIFLIGLGLLVLGYIGVFFGKLIKAAINRQREFLADASAVQFTRYPGGIAGALKKIGGLTEGSRIHDAHAEEVSHMFFGDAFAGSFFNLFATHPPLAARIRALEPEFDGAFPEVQPVVITAEAEKPTPRSRPGLFPPLPFPPFGAPAMPTAMALDAGSVAQRVGSPQAEHLDHAGQILDAIPQPLLDAAREPFAAQAVIYALLLSRDDEPTRTQQLTLLQAQIPPPLFQEVQQLASATQSLPPASRLPLASLAIPALKRSSAQQYAQFRQIVEALVHADRKVDLFEYCLRMVLFSYLDVHFGLKKPAAVRYRTAAAVAQPALVVLSMLAHVGQENPDDVQRAFQAGATSLLGQATLLPADQCGLAAFDVALAELAQAAPMLRRDIMTAVTACITADGAVTPEEGELLRAIAAVLSCPLPLDNPT